MLVVTVALGLVIGLVIGGLGGWGRSAAARVGDGSLRRRTGLAFAAVGVPAAFLGSVLKVDWAVVVPFTLASVVATLLGRRVAGRLSGAVLTRTFAVLLLIIGIFVGVESLMDG